MKSELGSQVKTYKVRIENILICYFGKRHGPNLLINVFLQIEKLNKVVFIFLNIRETVHTCLVNINIFLMVLLTL